MSILRPYQIKCVESVFREWEKITSTMIVIFTGGGKTRIFSEIVKRVYPKRSLIIAHRTELLHQAAKHVRDCGLEVQIEKAELKASSDLFHRTPVVVASVQTLVSGKETKRMHKFKPEDFGLLVCDELHHGTASSYRAIFDYFKQNKDLKVFGCTATPDRADKEALGQIIDSVAFQYDIAEGIDDGWLVPIEQQIVKVGTLDFSHVKTTAGDLNGADLARVMEDEKNLQGMTGAAIEIIGDRKSICFTASVKHAQMCAEIFNRHRMGMAAWVCGETRDDERALILKDFSERLPGETNRPQILVNVGVATEGFDAPSVECIIMGRPTKSRSLYTQMVGRSTRTLAGTLDDMHSAYERKQAISESAKPSALILDFAGNSGRHKLMTTLDILGGKYSEQVKDAALKKAKDSKTAVNMKKLLEETEAEIRARIEAEKLAAAARKARLVAKVNYSTRTVNPFSSSDLFKEKRMPTDFSKMLTPKEQSIIAKLGHDPHTIEYGKAKQLLIQHFHRISKGLCTLKQAKLLERHGYNTKEMKMVEASKLIDQLAKNGWKRTDTVAA